MSRGWKQPLKIDGCFAEYLGNRSESAGKFKWENCTSLGIGLRYAESFQRIGIIRREILPSCRTTRNGTRKGTRQRNRFSCRQHISNCWEDCLLASDECVLPAPSPSQVSTWRSLCSLPRQNPGTPCARSTRILKSKEHRSFACSTTVDSVQRSFDVPIGSLIVQCT